MVFTASWPGNSSQPHVSNWLWGKRNQPCHCLCPHKACAEMDPSGTPQARYPASERAWNTVSSPDLHQWCKQWNHIHQEQQHG